MIAEKRKEVRKIRCHLFPRSQKWYSSESLPPVKKFRFHEQFRSTRHEHGEDKRNFCRRWFLFFPPRRIAEIGLRGAVFGFSARRFSTKGIRYLPTLKVLSGSLQKEYNRSRLVLSSVHTRAKLFSCNFQSPSSIGLQFSCQSYYYLPFFSSLSFLFVFFYYQLLPWWSIDLSSLFIYFFTFHWTEIHSQVNQLIFLPATIVIFNCSRLNDCSVQQWIIWYIIVE